MVFSVATLFVSFLVSVSVMCSFDIDLTDKSRKFKVYQSYYWAKIFQKSITKVCVSIRKQSYIVLRMVIIVLKQLVIPVLHTYVVNHVPSIVNNVSTIIKINFT